MVKVSKYWLEKSVLRSFKNFTEKYLCMSLFLNRVAGLQPATFLKKSSCTGVFLQVQSNNSECLSCKTCPGVLLLNILLFITSTTPTKCYHWSCFFCFTLNIFRAITKDCLRIAVSESLRQSGMTQLMNCW